MPKKKAAPSPTADAAVPELKTYSVTVPFTGSIIVTVEAASEEEAIDKAFDHEDLTLDNPDAEWQCHRVICEGNVFHGDVNEAWAEEEG